ncbi:alpha/beta fold hydrolase [Oceanicoccus sp. KOV_DT_Chl]|uniref:alpha/beta fold hydrolase n=1 Tax=Oceanicoccus sp. KOV_DT_Chl TaxID=1904639 RepID=UPI000C7E486E|nr:alpha/beta hydrolase [Oceanicoccus sp. KOV_DT_Chl]
MRPTPMTFSVADGVTLVADSWGDPSHPPVIFSHGGGQTRHSWGGTAAKLAELGWFTLSYDHRGHGDSDWSPQGIYSFDEFGGDMQVIANSFKVKPHVVGASLGGLSAMVSAGEFEQGLFASITLVDVTPNLNRQGVEHIFTFMNTHMEEGFADLEEAADFIAQFTGRPRRDDLSGLEKNLRLRDGRYYWHWDPDFFNVKQDRVANPNRMSDAVKNIQVPMLLIRGRLSDVVTQQQVDEFMQLAPHAEYVDVEHARHMVAGDRNDIFTSAVTDFLNRQLLAE